MSSRHLEPDDAALFPGFAAVMPRAVQVGADTWIGDGLGNTVVIDGASPFALHAEISVSSEGAADPLRLLG